jgi:O-antigen/teichoic acid export membrane protein
MLNCGRPHSGPAPGGFRRASLTVLTGSGLGHFVGLALTPAIARLYSPDVFGGFASMLAVSTALVGISTFRLEVLAQRTTADSEARSLLRLALASSVAWGILSSVVAVGVAAFTGEFLWLAAGPLVMVASLQLVGGGVLTRRGEYRELAGANFAQGASAGSVQVGLGVLAPTSWSLLAGFMLARLVWIRPLVRFLPGDQAKLDRTPIRHYASMAGPSAFFSGLGGQAPILLASLLFGAGAAGLLAMSFRLVVSPLGIVSQAAAAATLGEVGRSLRDDQGSAERIVRRAMRDLFLLGLLPCSLAAAFGPWLVPLVLGPEWATTGSLIALLAAGTLAQLTVSPFAHVLNLLGRSRQLLVWDGSRLIGITAAWLIPWALGLRLPAVVGIYSITLVATYTLLWLLLRAALRASSGVPQVYGHGEAANSPKPDRGQAHD